MIALEGVHKRYSAPDGSSVDALLDIDLRIEEGETLVLIGTSGCGKTTTLKTINRLIEADRGKVSVAGRDVREQDPISLRRGMGYVLQSGGLFPHFDVEHNVGLLGRLEGWTRDRIQDRVFELLERVHLEPSDVARRFPSELSGGQRQRVGIARALLLDPPILLLDEPFGALDPVTRREVRTEFLQLEREIAKTAVMVTHDLEEAFELGDRIALMEAGRLVEVGTPEDLQARPREEFTRRFLSEHLGGSK